MNVIKFCLKLVIYQNNFQNLSTTSNLSKAIFHIDNSIVYHEDFNNFFQTGLVNKKELCTFTHHI